MAKWEESSQVATIRKMEKVLSEEDIIAKKFILLVAHLSTVNFQL